MYKNVYTHITHNQNTNIYIYMHECAPKVMPSIYFHGNYNRYSEHYNTVRSSIFPI